MANTSEQEELARDLALAFHGDEVEWRGFLSKAALILSNKSVRLTAKPAEDPADVWDAYCAEVPAKRRSPQGALAFGFEAGAKPDEEGVREARPEDIAIALCLVDGHNPDDEAPRTVMCDGDNMPVPWWMVYTEYAEALIGKFNISRRASTTGAPKP